jgi:hypothetical protein
MVVFGVSAGVHSQKARTRRCCVWFLLKEVSVEEVSVSTGFY